MVNNLLSTAHIKETHAKVLYTCSNTNCGTTSVIKSNCLFGNLNSVENNDLIISLRDSYEPWSTCVPMPREKSAQKNILRYFVLFVVVHLALGPSK